MLIKGVWFHRQRSPGERPDRDPAASLNWSLEQMLFEQFGMYADAKDGVVVDLTSASIKRPQQRGRRKSRRQRKSCKRSI